MNWHEHSTVRGTDYARASQTSEFHLLPMFGPGTLGRAARLHDGTMTLGRGTGSSEIAVSDPKVSRVHAELIVSGSGTRIEIIDRSANGTWVDGDRIERAELHDGSIVRLGDTFLLVRAIPQTITNAAVEGLIGSAPCMKQLRHEITRVAAEQESVLIIGESGTGKELIAQSLHRLSGRKGPFVAVNCAAISETVADSLLFGHTAGSFTGARADHDGYFRAAQGGTLFLDEIGDLPVSLQPKLLRALETRTVCPVGSSLPVRCDVRVLFATHRELGEEAQAGRFRGDLFARIAQITLRAPPLRERREDILPLLRSSLGSEVDTFPTDVVEALLVDPWAYNVRELLAVAKRMRILGVREGVADLSLIRARKEAPLTRSARPSAMPKAAPISDEPPSRERVMEVVTRLSGNIRRAAEELGRSRKQVYRYVVQYGMDLDALRKEGPSKTT